MTAAKKLFLIFALFLAALYISLPNARLNLNYGRISINKNFDLVLGLDLAGGSHLVFEADTTKLFGEEKETALSSVKEVIERRVNLFGVSEPNVQVSSFEGKDRIIVELPGVNDPEEAIELVGKTAQLSFAEVVQVEEESRLSPTDLTGADLKSAQVTFESTTGSPSVGIEFNEGGAEKFAKLTEKNVGNPLPILLDGNVVSAPIVQAAITGGSAQITGNFTLEAARELAIQLNAGALPLNVELVEQRTIGATLGADSVAKSVNAGLVGLGMVLLFMFLAYRRLGLLADIALLIFGVLTLSLYKLIPVVLTLPGIAGFLLSVGMAVDSNILIFERFKEEKGKRNVSDALEISFGRAWDSIRDANIATLFAAFILANPFDWQFLHTSGPVRGFAMTLALGIGLSLFTGIVVTRNLLRVFFLDRPRRLRRHPHLAPRRRSARRG